MRKLLFLLFLGIFPLDSIVGTIELSLFQEIMIYQGILFLNKY